MDTLDCIFDKSETSSNNTSLSSQESYSSIKKDNTKIRMMDLLQQIVDTKIHCIQFLQRHKVIPTYKKCPGPLINGKRYGNCGKDMTLKEVHDQKDNITWRCRRVHKIIMNGRQLVKKDVKVTVRENTWLQNSNLTLEEILIMLYCWSNNFNNQQIQHEVNCSDKSVSSWCYFLRQSCLSRLIDCSERIGGPGIEVEIDESKFGKRKYYKGHPVEGQWIFGGRETLDKKKIFMAPVENRKKDTLLKLIQDNIEIGSIIQSDCWKAYKEISNLGYTHITVNHSEHFKDPKTGACTNRIESEWRHAKVSMPTYGVRQGQHETYLAEFMWRQKFSDEDLFITIIEQLNIHFDRKYFKRIP